MLLTSVVGTQNITVLYDANHYTGTAPNMSISADEVQRERDEERQLLKDAMAALLRERAPQAFPTESAATRVAAEGTPPIATASVSEGDGLPPLVHGLDADGVVQDFEAFAESMGPQQVKRLRAILNPAAVVCHYRSDTSAANMYLHFC